MQFQTNNLYGSNTIPLEVYLTSIVGCRVHEVCIETQFEGAQTTGWYILLLQATSHKIPIEDTVDENQILVVECDLTPMNSHKATVVH